MRRAARASCAAAAVLAVLALAAPAHGVVTAGGAVRGALVLTPDPATSQWERPPGGEIVYSAVAGNRGWIEVVSLDDTGTRRLTPAAGGRHDRHPVWSPDGRRVAFVRSAGAAASGVHVVGRRGGAARRVASLRSPAASGARPEWSPDGRRLAFAAETRCTPGPFRHLIGVARTDGRGTARFPALSRVRALTTIDVLGWSPDGGRLLYAAHRVGDCRKEFPASSELFSARADGMDRRRLAFGGGILAAGALTGSSAAAPRQAAPATIAYSLKLFPSWNAGFGIGGVCLARADGRGSSRLTAPADDWDPAWSPDGRFLAFSRTTTFGVPQPHQYDVWVRDMVRGGEHLVSSQGSTFNYGLHWHPDGRSFVFSSGWRHHGLHLGTIGRGHGWFFSPEGNLGGYAFAPDGRRLAVVEHRGSDSAISVLDLYGEGGGLLVPFRPGETGALEWSPDGRTIAFIRLRSGGVFDLYAVDAEGGEPRLLAEGADEPAWAPDGTRVAYVNLSGDIVVAAADGGDRRVMAATRARESAPAWSPDGRSLAFLRSSGGRHAIVVARPDGSQARVVVRSRFRLGAPRWRPGGGGGSSRPCVRSGTPRADVMRGTRHDDVLLGEGGDDRLSGGAGRDVLDGGAGADVLEGGPGNDVLHGGRGRDRLLGGPGNDQILSRDGQRDEISCGPGRDWVVADRLDAVASDCESVVQR